ncbi:MAG: TetR/AcrR family transcriptional regulator [Campylobacteraceae bacterium]|jgi:TetR/AcrR family transcriptional repressor of cmeABC operon|nr:TetR/AcrR family transcriptional regulator [Campylobacteraceae bacterium]
MKKNKTTSIHLKTIKKSLSPKEKARYDKLIDAAAEVFLEYGFEKAKMSEIVKRAGGSLVTIYKIFGNKETIFTEVLSKKTEKVFSGIVEYSTVSYSENFEDFLYDIGKKIIALTTNDIIYTFHRLIVSEGYKNDAKVGKLFFENAIKRTASIVAEYFEGERERGNIDIEDPVLAAYQFLHLLKEPFFFAKVLGVNTNNNPIFDVEKSLRQTVKIFSRAMLVKK